MSVFTAQGGDEGGGGRRAGRLGEGPRMRVDLAAAGRFIRHAIKVAQTENAAEVAVNRVQQSTQSDGMEVEQHQQPELVRRSLRVMAQEHEEQEQQVPPARSRQTVVRGQSLNRPVPPATAMASHPFPPASTSSTLGGHSTRKASAGPAVARPLAIPSPIAKPKLTTASFTAASSSMLMSTKKKAAKSAGRAKAKAGPVSVAVVKDKPKAASAGTRPFGVPPLSIASSPAAALASAPALVMAPSHFPPLTLPTFPASMSFSSASAMSITPTPLVSPSPFTIAPLAPSMPPLQPFGTVRLHQLRHQQAAPLQAFPSFAAEEAPRPAPAQPQPQPLGYEMCVHFYLPPSFVIPSLLSSARTT